MIVYNFICYEDCYQFEILQYRVQYKPFRFKYKMDSEAQRAIQLIEVNSAGKYVLSEEGKAFISKIQGPIAVISVAGMYRTGKSYLLNRMLLNRCNGFGVGPTVNPCTKGLWCWGKTIPGKTADGESINVIVIDTEGIGALDEDQTHDTRIFTLAILAASAFIYNSTGSIDENALQNLSLVVNLTKNIQLNTQNEDEEDDPEQLANYLPAFYWVVRDFSLQLINSDGESITPKEYLERALAPQKGFSDDVEQKNRIRRLLSSFFKERQCFTLVRPLVDEKKLQHLDQLDLDQLRPEFVDQVMNFRRRILGRVKPKVFKGKQLDGPMYLCLLNSYVTAINNGAVPNIENAWNYMCQQKCAQAFQYSLSYFNEEAEKSVRAIFPAQEQFLLEQLKELKQKACDLLESNSVGDKVKFHVKELRQNIEHKIDLLRMENQKHAESMLRNYFKKGLLEIENKLRLREYQSFQDFMKELNKYYSNSLENGPVLPRKQAVFLTLLRKVIPAAADIFLKDQIEIYKNFKAVADQKQLNSHSTIEQLKRQIKESEERSKQKLTKLDREKIELQLELEDVKKIVQELRQKSTHQNEKWQAQIKHNMESYKKKEESFNEKVLGLNQQISQLQGQMMAMRCDQQKQSALITLRNKQLQAEIEESRRKEAQAILSMKNLQISGNSNLKSITEQYEQKLKEKQIEIRQLKTSLTDMEEHTKIIESEIQTERTESEDQIIKLKLSLNKKENELVKLSKEKEDFEKQMRMSTDAQIDRLKQDLLKSLEKASEMEKQLKNYTQQSTNKQRSYETELVLLKQKIEFVEVQARDYKNQLTKAKRQYEEKLASILEENSLKEDQSTKMQEQAQAYEARIVQLKTETDQTTRKLMTEIEDLTKQLAETQLQLKTSRNKFQILTEQMSRVTKQLKSQLEGQEGDLENQIANLKQEWRTKQKIYQDKIQKLQTEMEETKEEMLRQQRQDHEKSEQIVLQLKNYYQIEKQKLENKLVAEKEKQERKLADLKAEHEEKLREETMELESENEFLKEKFGELEQELMKERTNRKIEIDIKNKQIENLEKTQEQMKSKIDNKEVELINKNERLQKEHTVEKESLYARIEQQMTKISKLDKEKSGLAGLKDQLQKSLLLKERNIEELKEELAAIKDKFENDKEKQKQARNDMTTKLMSERVEFEKKIALLSQQTEYLKLKIEESDKLISTYEVNHQEKLRKLKEQYAQELKAARDKSQFELESLQSKYEKTKKLGKQKEAQMQKQISQLEKELAISNQKNLNFIDKLKTYEEKQLSQSEQHNAMLANLKSNFAKQSEILREQLESEQKEKEKLEGEKKTLIASFQQQKLLLENRNKFESEGKERYRQDYEDTKAKLELAVQSHRKKWIQEKTNLQLAQSEHVSKLQKKFWQQKQELSEYLKKQESQFQNKIKILESENRVLTEKLAIEEQNKMGSQNDTDRRLKQLTEQAKRLQSELDKAKSAKQTDQMELQNHEKEKQHMKQKLKLHQQKYRTLEKQKNTLWFDNEKQKARWKAQKEAASTKIEQLKELVQKFEKEIEKLQRENEKLKVERKCQKTSIQSMTRFSGFGIDRGMSRSNLEESILKENSNNTSQISDTSIFFKE